MKKFVIVLIGSLLFLAGYNYTRRQAEYTATQNSTSKPVQAKVPAVLPFKGLPALVIQPHESSVGWN